MLRFTSLQDGDNKLFIFAKSLPTGIHYIEGPGPARMLWCPRLAGLRSDCWLCTQSEQDDDKRGDTRRTYASLSVKAYERHVYYTVPLAAPELMMLIAPSKLSIQLELALALGDHPEGSPVTITRSGMGLMTRFEAKPGVTEPMDWHRSWFHDETAQRIRQAQAIIASYTCDTLPAPHMPYLSNEEMRAIVNPFQLAVGEPL